MHNTTTVKAITVDTVAQHVDGELRVAPQPLGTWMSRWWFLYTDAAVPAVEQVERHSVQSLPRYVFAA